MSKGFKGFLFGLFGLIVVICVAVLIYGSCNDMTFLGVLRHWLGA